MFKLSGITREAVNAILRREDLLDDENYVTLAREVRREGRSTARINGNLVNVGLLREVGACLVDIHGRAEHLSLLDYAHHLPLLDRYAGVDALLNAYRQTCSALQALRRELAELRAQG